MVITHILFKRGDLAQGCLLEFRELMPKQQNYHDNIVDMNVL